ncbi:glycosyltransferase [Pseudoduganella umbonata]|uniref:Glycosyltransferase n=1 Tax=Pseudoduganella umbonata TaxID=864828 RepID=A0A4P8HPM0_9BURK|nr:glycosyltransferase [Pseudoduganella umbonata]MBB3220856.1 glycosyltransferase involved in cell wall biosynthesis [Pseudoduganella umbonata]QCP11683.1 glycosyltransferase [Pseudoduganella umbonata]
MRIVIDLQASQASSANRGIGRYSLALATAMARRAGPHELHLVLNNHFPDSIASLRRAFDGLLPASRIHTFDVPAPIAEYDKANAWRIRAAEQLREHFIASLKPDVVHVASLFEGLGDNAVASVAHGTGRFDTAVTLYDLIPLQAKEKYLAEPHVANWYYRKLQGLKNAELLLGISGYTADEAVSVLQLPQDRVVNISSAVDDIFQPQPLAPAEREALRQRYGLHREFIMYTGGIDYRKNIEGLITAYAALPADTRRRYQLAIVCNVHEGDRIRLQRHAEAAGVPRGDLVLTGFVPDADLVALYNSTALFVFPSLQEGFGLPALEAMACGAPVIGSNTTSIPEVIGRPDALFDPGRVDDIAAHMQAVLGDEQFAQSLREHGLRQAKLFSWDESARRTLEAFEDVHRRAAPARQAVAALEPAAPARRRRLAYVSPLPPERSGIADYSAELLPELARYYDIDVILAQDTLTDTWVAANFPQRSVAWFDDHAHEFDRILYHFGNSSFHSHMFGLLERHPGIVVLHDFFLSGIVNYLEPAAPYPNAYCRAIYESHGYYALTDEIVHGREYSLYQCPANQAVLSQASGMIVHSEHSRELADAWYGAGTAADWQMIPLLRVLPGHIDRDGARRKLGIADGDFVVCTFGLLGLTKCNDKLLEAWLNSSLGSDERCHLVFVGENNILQFGRDLVARIGDHPRIRITGFASQELYRLYLAAADCAVQLRSRSRGETSATVLDCLAYRLPTVINAHGSAAEVADDVAIKLPDQFTEQELADAILRLRHDRQMAQDLSQRAGAYMRKVHHPAHIGAMYRDTIERFAHDSAGARYRELMASLGAIGTAAEPSEDDLAQTALCIATNRLVRGKRQLLIDVDDLIAGTRPEAQAAAQRSLVRRLLQAPPPGYRVEPVRRDERGVFRYARRYTLDRLIDRPELVLDDSVIEFHPHDSFLMFCGAADDGTPPQAQSNRGLHCATVRLLPDEGAMPSGLAGNATVLRAELAGAADLPWAGAVPPRAHGSAGTPMLADQLPAGADALAPLAGASLVLDRGTGDPAILFAALASGLPAFIAAEAVDNMVDRRHAA